MTVPVWAWFATLAVLPTVIGVMMLSSPMAHLPVTVSLIVIIIMVGCAVAASLRRDRTRPRPADEPERTVPR